MNPEYHPGQFIKLKWWVGQICDVAASGHAFELESIYYLASKTIARQWILTEHVASLTELLPQDAIQYSEAHDLAYLTDLLTDLDALEARWRQEPPVSSPFPASGQFVKVCEWRGRIRDVGEAQDRTFLVIESPKRLSRSSGEYEVLEVKPKHSYRQIALIERAEALAEIPRFRCDVQTRIHRAQEILTRWKHGN